MLSSLKCYNSDCRRIIGSTLYHDDSLNDRTVGGTLDIAFTQTKTLWKQQYNEDYATPGGMYRGEPPKEYFKPTWSPEVGHSLRANGPYVSLINIHGASSTTPASTTGAKET